MWTLVMLRLSGRQSADLRHCHSATNAATSFQVPIGGRQVDPSLYVISNCCFFIVFFLFHIYHLQGLQSLEEVDGCSPSAKVLEGILAQV